MDSKTLATIMLVIICVLLFPVAVGIVGGIFGVAGSVLGGIFGLIAGAFGVIFGVIAAIFGAIFGIFGWMTGDFDYWDCSFNFFNGDVFTAILLVLVIVAITRSKAPRKGNNGPAP